MSKETKELIEKMKEAIFTGKYSLCDNGWWCGLNGYCPTYECGQLDKIKRYSDRQWENGIKYANKQYKTTSWTLRDYIDCILNEYLIYQRPSEVK